MSEKNVLELLAPELQIQILSNALSPDDLYSLIRASPRLYEIYRLNKLTILSAVAHRQFHPAIMSDVLFFAKISQLRQPLSRNTVLELCRAYPIDLQGMTITIAMSVAMCKLARGIKFFVEDYARNTLPLVEDLGRSLEVKVMPEYWPKNPVSYAQLSDSEVGRLQRAFCRFEIYRYLFARCSPEIDHKTSMCADRESFSTAEQASLFLEKFPDFQVVEINCIRDYLFRRLRGLFNRLEDQAVDTLPPETFKFDQRGDFESQEWSSGVWLFCESGRGYQNSHIEHLMSLGLAYTHRIFESTGEEQRNLFIRHDDCTVINHIERHFISESIERLGRNPRRGDIPLLPEADPPFIYEVNAEAELDIPEAWQWAHPRAPPQYLYERFTKGLRDWGYVFWDLRRLRASGILEQSREDISRIRFDEYDASRHPSVQVRLLGPFDYRKYNIDGNDSDTSETSEFNEELRENFRTRNYSDFPDHPDSSPPSSGNHSGISDETYEGPAEMFHNSEV